jgi:ArsR family transcriptional regulator
MNAAVGHMAGKAGQTMSAVKEEECCPDVVASALSETRAAELARDFAVLADPVRLRLLSFLATSSAGEVCVCELVEPLGRSQPTVSHHIKILAEAGLIEGEKRGRWVWYRTVPSRLAELNGVLRF